MKTKITDLAVFGGPAAFERPVVVGRPNIGDRERLAERFNNILDSRWLTNNGPYLREFERRIAEYTGANYCVAVANATVGLEIILRSLGLSGEVILPSMTFIATAHSVAWQNLTPVFCDIDAFTWNLDPTKIESLITNKTVAILGVHLFGRPCDIESLAGIAAEYDLKLIYDAAHAFGCSYRGKMIGNFGNAEVFSFHTTKFLNSIEGGAIVTNDSSLAAKASLMRNFGFEQYRVLSIGTNGKMHELSAAMGITSLEKISDFVSIGRQNYEEYRRCLSNIPGVELIVYDQKEKSNYQYIVIDINSEIAGIDRDEILKILKSENVVTRGYFSPTCHEGEPYASEPRYSSVDLNVTNSIAKRLLALPTGETVGLEEIEKISQIIRFSISHSKRVKQEFAGIKNVVC